MCNNCYLVLWSICYHMLKDARLNSLLKIDFIDIQWHRVYRLEVHSY